MVHVKICGLTTPQDAVAAIECGADAVGFNFFPGSKRYVRPESAAAWIAKLPGDVEKVAVLVNPSWAEAIAVARLAGITALQLHGTETPEFCHRLKENGIRFAKAVPVIDSESLENLPVYYTSTLLLDSGGPGFGGSGRTFPWPSARHFVQARPEMRVILAGGLTPENVAQAIATVQPFGVDVTTGVESSAGLKDYVRMRDFIVAARAI